MYFKIIVSLGGRHYFTTTENSIRTADKAVAVWDDFVRAFPPDSDYEISCELIETTGKAYSRDELRNLDKLGIC